MACAQRQMCLVHLLRELESTAKYKSPDKGWAEFEKKVRRLFGDAIRLWYGQADIDATSFASRRSRLDQRLTAIIETAWEEANAKRLVKRFRRHQADMFTFLDKEGVPFENNFGERAIRPAVIIRKNSYGNRSDQGANCQAAMMSIFATLKQRGLDPIKTIHTAVQAYLETGEPPNLPENASDH